MKLAYFDCHSGISGDMILGALVDLGVPLVDIQKELKKLKLKGYEISAKKVKRGGFGATHVIVDQTGKHKHHHPHRTFVDIKKMIEDSRLSPAIQKNAMGIFQILGKAEAKVHRTTLNKIHFHEVGSVDSIVDIVGSVVAMEALQFDGVTASPLNTGEGTVHCEHGMLPVPAPATLEILKGIPCFSSGVKTELVTPTGAAILKHYAKSFGPIPAMTLGTNGYGAGSKILKEIPNFLRILTGETGEGATETLCVIETNIDDMNPELYDRVMQLLLKQAARDVFFTPVIMKKGRPGTKLTVLCDPDKRKLLANMILTETTSFGIRWWEVARETLDRQWVTVKIQSCPIKVKIGMLEGEVVQVSPEYEDCKKASAKLKKPVKAIYQKAQQLAGE